MPLHGLVQSNLDYPGLDYANFSIIPWGTYYQKNWVGVCDPLLKTLTLFVAKIFDFPYPIYDLTKNLIPYLLRNPFTVTSYRCNFHYVI